MRRIEVERGIVNLSYDTADPEALRVRRAVVGGFRDYLDADDIEYVRSQCEQRLSPEARALLAGHGLEPWRRARAQRLTISQIRAIRSLWDSTWRWATSRTLRRCSGPAASRWEWSSPSSGCMRM